MEKDYPIFHTVIDSNITVEIVKEECTEPIMHIYYNYAPDNQIIVSLIEDKILSGDNVSIMNRKVNIDFLNDNWENFAKMWNDENNNNFDFSKIERPVYKEK